jgi:hypothetical protein
VFVCDKSVIVHVCDQTDVIVFVNIFTFCVYDEGDFTRVCVCVCVCMLSERLDTCFCVSVSGITFCVGVVRFTRSKNRSAFTNRIKVVCRSVI